MHTFVLYRGIKVMPAHPQRCVSRRGAGVGRVGRHGGEEEEGEEERKWAGGGGGASTEATVLEEGVRKQSNNQHGCGDGGGGESNSDGGAMPCRRGLERLEAYMARWG